MYFAKKIVLKSTWIPSSLDDGWRFGCLLRDAPSSWFGATTTDFTWALISNKRTRNREIRRIFAAEEPFNR